MQIPDGGHCACLPESEGIPLISAGWLEGGFDYSMGTATDAFFTLLCHHVRDAWRPPYVFAGKHACSLCQFGRSVTRFNDFEFHSESGSELFIPTGRSIWVTPINILHSIASHHYLPPPEFIAAVEACPPQRSVAYLRLLLDSGGREWFANVEKSDIS